MEPHLLLFGSTLALYLLYLPALFIKTFLNLYTMKRFFIFLFISLLIGTAKSQLYNFETTLPSTFTTDKQGSISLSLERSKEGKQSLLWSWDGPSTLQIAEESALSSAVNSFGSRAGITLWIYNETPHSHPLRFSFKDKSGAEKYYFDFHLTHIGWKACWIAFKDMWTPTGGKTAKEAIVSMEIASAENTTNGRIFIDRFKILNAVDTQTIPDAQIPDNNRHNTRDLWHWGWIWRWEQLQYDTPLPSTVSAKELEDMALIRERIKANYKGSAISALELNGLLNNLKKWGIGVDNAVGVKPLVSVYDPQYSATNDYNLTNLSDLLNKLARGWYMNNNQQAKTGFINTIKWAIDQGFSLGCAMGTNHHYGYEIRSLFPAVLWMQEPLREAGILDLTAKTIAHWSGLPESRVPYNINRDEICDSWNTLLIARLCSALLYPTDQEQLRALRSFFRWTSGSLNFTPGTIGGIKIDGTGFHHGGHYPAYSVPGYSAFGEMLSYSNDTDFGLSQEGKDILKLALLSTVNYSNDIDWGIGVCGRHPLNSINKIGTSSQTTYGQLALAYRPIDKELAGQYLRISPNNALKTKILGMGITESAAPSGAFSFNYACHGIFRDKNWMVSMKGFNKWVWGSEIYTKDNRFGRYQSYGSIQIIVNSEIESRWTQPGWDWNRLPGTTTIHLPLDQLNSPLSGTLMDRSTETFSGFSALMGRYGLFATKIKESNRTNFTPTMVARKSYFCVDNRIVCLTTGISNTNSSYPTETTLFQQSLQSESESFIYNGNSMSSFPLNNRELTTQPTILSDLTGNYYTIPTGANIVLLKQEQNSRNDKTQAATKGKFATAYLDHGTAPAQEHYEYMITVQASKSDIDNLEIKPYQVIQQTNAAHIVEDLSHKVVGYTLFDDYQNGQDRFITSADKETLILLQYDQPHIMQMSICDPNINIGDNSYTSTNPSQPIIKKLVINGIWSLKEAHPQITLSCDQSSTTVTASCVHGIPIDIALIDQEYSAIDQTSTDQTIEVTTSHQVVTINGAAAHIKIYNLQGMLIKECDKQVGPIRVALTRGGYIITTDQQGQIENHKIIL